MNKKKQEMRTPRWFDKLKELHPGVYTREELSEILGLTKEGLRQALEKRSVKAKLKLNGNVYKAEYNTKQFEKLFKGKK